jgi:hypothetical protein
LQAAVTDGGMTSWLLLRRARRFGLRPVSGGGSMA